MYVIWPLKMRLRKDIFSAFPPRRASPQRAKVSHSGRGASTDASVITRPLCTHAGERAKRGGRRFHTAHTSGVRAGVRAGRRGEARQGLPELIISIFHQGIFTYYDLRESNQVGGG